MTDEERIARAKEMLERSIGAMCQEIGRERNCRLQWDGWGAEWFFVRRDDERFEVPGPADWLADYPEASAGYQRALQRRIREKLWGLRSP